MKYKKHDLFVQLVHDDLKSKGFKVDFEIPLIEGKGAADALARKKLFDNDEFVKIYLEAKSSPASINSKGVLNQLNKYKSYFGEQFYYGLVSPNAKGDIKYVFLDDKNPPYFFN